MSFFTQAESEKAAFAMLTSSSLARYARNVEALASATLLATRLNEDPAMIPELVNQSLENWRRLFGSRQRTEDEVELALMLALLARTSDPRVDDLLLQFSLADQPSVAWISAFARHLRSRRACNFEGPFRNRIRDLIPLRSLSRSRRRVTGARLQALEVEAFSFNVASPWCAILRSAAQLVDVEAFSFYDRI